MKKNIEKNTISRFIEHLPQTSNEQIKKSFLIKWKTQEEIYQILRLKNFLQNCLEQWIKIVPKQENYFSNQVTILNNKNVNSSFDYRIRKLQWKEVIVIPNDCREKNWIKTVRIIPLNEVIDSWNLNDPTNNPIYINPKFFQKKTISESLKNELNI